MEAIKAAKSEVIPKIDPPIEKSEVKPTKSNKVKLKPIPPFKGKIKTHTRTEQETLSPSLPLRGGSSGSISSMIIEKSTQKAVEIPKSLPVVRNLLDNSDDSSQILDTGAKPPQRVAWFILLWTFICSNFSNLQSEIKDIFILIWTWILLRFPFLSSKNTANSTGLNSKKFTRSLKKPNINRNIKNNTRLPLSKDIRRK